MGADFPKSVKALEHMLHAALSVNSSIREAANVEPGNYYEGNGSIKRRRLDGSQVADSNQAGCDASGSSSSQVWALKVVEAACAFLKFIDGSFMVYGGTRSLADAQDAPERLNGLLVVARKLPCSEELCLTLLRGIDYLSKNSVLASRTHDYVPLSEGEVDVICYDEQASLALRLAAAQVLCNQHVRTDDPQQRRPVARLLLGMVIDAAGRKSVATRLQAAAQLYSLVCGFMSSDKVKLTVRAVEEIFREHGCDLVRAAEQLLAQPEAQQAPAKLRWPAAAIVARVYKLHQQRPVAQLVTPISDDLAALLMDGIRDGYMESPHETGTDISDVLAGSRQGLQQLARLAEVCHEQQVSSRPGVPRLHSSPALLSTPKAAVLQTSHIWVPCKM